MHPKNELDKPEIEKLTERAIYLAGESISKSTIRAYKSDWKQFVKWCDQHNFLSLPAESKTVALYCADRSKKSKTSTITRFLSVIAQYHKMNNFENPCGQQTVKIVLSGIRKTNGTRRTKAEPITWSILKKMLDKCSSSVLGRRDAAILSIGWAGAFRRSELIGLTNEDLSWVDEGLLISITNSKTDQTRHGQSVAIPRRDGNYCPVALLSTWVERMEIRDGPLFFALRRNSDSQFFQLIDGERRSMSHLMVNNIVKKYIKLIGLNPTHYSSHSLRRGLATEAGRLMVPERIVMRHTRHKSVETLRGYMDSGSAFIENPLLAVYLSDKQSS